MVEANRTISNARDTGRKWHTDALAPNVLKESEGVVCERIVGPAAAATVVLSRPAVGIRNVQSFTTATGVASTGGVPAKKEYLREGVDFSVNLNDPNNGNKASLKELAGADYSAETWVVWYSPLAAEGTPAPASSV